MKLKYTFAIQEVGEKYVAVAIGEDADKFKAMIKLNSTGKLVFELLKDEKTEEEVLNAFYKQYPDADKELIKTSVTSYLATLKEKGLLTD